MGKLVDKLRQVGQGNGGGGVGFFGMSRQQSRPPRPAAIVVTVGASDAQAAQAAIGAGADVLIVSGWQPNVDTTAIAAAAGDQAIWGVEYAAEGRHAEGTLKKAKDAGAAFAVLSQSTPAVALYDDVESFDFVIQLDIPRDDLGLVLLRAENLLPVQAAMFTSRISSADVARMSVADYARLRLATESLRFLVLLPLADAPQQAHVKPLVRLGVNGLVLQGAGVAPATLGEQVKALREQLEKTPLKGDDRDGETVAITGLMQSAGSSITRREPAPAEPDEE